MEKSFSNSYAKSGVDVTAGYRSVELIKGHVARTLTPGALGGIGGFGGLFSPDLTGINNPVLVSGSDGVGTKLKIAFLLDRHNTIGVDCVAMCVNDIICCGATPLFFQDYIACGKNKPEKISQIVSGIADGCVLAGCALTGGETAEHPGLMQEDEYDIAGFAVGIVDKDKILDNRASNAGDAIIAVASSGIHSNGFSLVRKVLDVENADLLSPCPELNGAPLGEVLLEPTKIYVKAILSLLKSVAVHGISHITGGGFYENIPRSVPDGLYAKIDRKAVKAPPIFQFIARRGEIPEKDMFNTFNMGVGMTVTVAAKDVDIALEILRNQGEDAYVIGELASGREGVVIC